MSVLYLRTTCAVAISLIASAASAATISLRAGDYGNTSLACDNEPNAGIMSFNGRNFYYAHLTKCTDRVIGIAGGVMHIKETCRATGDGTPRAPYTQTFRLRLDSRESFTLIAVKDSAQYRRCGDLTYFDKH